MTAPISHSLFIILSIFCFASTVANAGQSSDLSPVNGDTQIIAVEELAAEFHKEYNCITVSALIRNISRTTLRGYATIYFLSSEGQEIYSYEDEVNEGKAFANGATVAFESTSRVGNVNKIASISVDFTKR